MKDTLIYILKAIVTNEDAVRVEEEEREDATYYTISVDAADIGKVIGKEGKIIRSIRNVMKIPAIKQNKRINISLAESQPQSTS
jgi:uncharacterized protein